MCGLYSVTSNREAIRAWAGVMAENDRTAGCCTDPPDGLRNRPGVGGMP
jgi:hypothetical protein